MITHQELARLILDMDEKLRLQPELFNQIFLFIHPSDQSEFEIFFCSLDWIPARVEYVDFLSCGD